VFSLPPDSRRLSSNIEVSPYFTDHVKLDTDCVPFAPESNPVADGGHRSSVWLPTDSLPTIYK
ncbi:MAG: hypothetical protein WAM69_11810, partial [Candidatus Sulfotelmatobacter sp.]